MPTGDKRIFAATSATHNVTAIVSATHFAIRKGSTKAIDPGVAGTPGPADEIVTNRSIEVTVFGEDPDELMGFVEAAAANFVGGYLGAAGAAKTVTVKNVKFNDPPQEVAFPFKDSGASAGTFSITGKGQWGASDTFALMEVHT